MEKDSNVEQKRFVKALNIKQEDLFEAKFNLIGFFGTLYKIDQRLKKEKSEAMKNLQDKKIYRIEFKGRLTNNKTL